MNRVFLQFCSSSDPQFKDFESRHYPVKMDVGDPNATAKSKPAGAARGHHGQQIHYLIWVFSPQIPGGEVVGVISGGSAIFASKGRDTFFGLDKFPRPKRGETSPYLSGIVHNTLFRLERNEFNLASKVVSLWRRQVSKDWRSLYGAEVYGFETYVDETSPLRDKKSDGGLYRADNWVFVGETQGSCKDHVGKGLTGGLTGNPFRRRRVSVKLGYCKWVKGFSQPLACEYKSSWRASTPEEKAIAKQRAASRIQLVDQGVQELRAIQASFSNPERGGDGSKT